MAERQVSFAPINFLLDTGSTPAAGTNNKAMNIEQTITDTLLQRPLGFKAGKRLHFYLYQPTLGKTYLNGALVRLLNINTEQLAKNPYMEIIRVFVEQNDICMRLIVLNTFKGADCLDNVEVDKRISLLKRKLDINDAINLLARVLSATNNTTQELQNVLGVTGELKDMHRAQEAKKDSSTLTYCGKTIWGSMIDALAEKYGWTLDYILWGISLANVQMLLADSVKTVYLTEEERKAANIYNKATVLDGNDPATLEKLKQFRWD